MSGVSKINGIALANVGKVNNIAIANVGKVSGITVPSAAYSSANSVFFDNTNDYGIINGCVLPTDEGSVSFWLKLGQTMGTDIIFFWGDNMSGSGSFSNGYIDVRLQNNSGTPAARHLVFTYADGSSGQARACSMKASSAHHGTGYSRWKYNAQDVGPVSYTHLRAHET